MWLGTQSVIHVIVALFALWGGGFTHQEARAKGCHFHFSDEKTEVQEKVTVPGWWVADSARAEAGWAAGVGTLWSPEDLGPNLDLPLTSWLLGVQPWVSVSAPSGHLHWDAWSLATGTWRLGFAQPGRELSVVEATGFWRPERLDTRGIFRQQVYCQQGPEGLSPPHSLDQEPRNPLDFIPRGMGAWSFTFLQESM